MFTTICCFALGFYFSLFTSITVGVFLNFFILVVTRTKYTIFAFVKQLFLYVQVSWMIFYQSAFEMSHVKIKLKCTCKLYNNSIKQVVGVIVVVIVIIKHQNPCVFLAFNVKSTRHVTHNMEDAMRISEMSTNNTRHCAFFQLKSTSAIRVL